ncbi:MAG: aldehyde dehydrogenase family protein [Pseudomonadota bacterium]|nr:aldehyde dehydrogenase family protein [Pseudomonadota bacterium]
MTTTATSFIDGAFLPAGDGFELPVFDPTSGQQASALREADAAEVDAAVKAARAAFGPWSALGSEARSNVLQAIDAKLRAHGDELAELEARTSGLPISGVRPLIDRAAENFKRFAEVASMMAGETFQQNEKYLTYTTREAKGVAALIAPWNAPLALGSMRLATCIAFGNTCVLKPSEYTPQSTLRMVELMHEAGLPKGVVNVVNGRGSVTGEALTTHPDIDMIGFTGGTTTGRRIMAAAGERLTPVTMELGGKSAAIVAPDADLERALDGTLLAIYASNGQQCLGGSRILVHESIAEEFIAAFVARAKAIRIGDPCDPATEMGPLAFEAHRAHVQHYLDVAREDGAEILHGGTAPEGRTQGWFMEPIVARAPSNAARICQEEIFGPFATFLTYSDLDEAIAMANASDFGLVSYVWTRDLATAMACSARIRAGTIWVNTPMMRELRAPFGGYKESGIGRDGARHCADFFTEAKTTSIPLEDTPIRRLGA